MDVVRKDLSTYTIKELLILARHYELNVNESLPQLLDKVAKHNYSRAVRKGTLSGKELEEKFLELDYDTAKRLCERKYSQQEQAQLNILTDFGVYDNIVKDLSYEDLKNLCATNKYMYTKCKEDDIWRAWLKHQDLNSKLVMPKLVRKVVHAGDENLIRILKEEGVDIHAYYFFFPKLPRISRNEVAKQWMLENTDYVIKSYKDKTIIGKLVDNKVEDLDDDDIAFFYAEGWEYEVNGNKN